MQSNQFFLIVTILLTGTLHIENATANPSCNNPQADDDKNSTLINILEKTLNRSCKKFIKYKRIYDQKNEKQFTVTILKKDKPSEEELNNLLSKANKHKVKCYKQEYKTCNKDKKKTIKKEKLNQLFQDWVKSPIYRMRSPEINCHDRAYLLSEELSKLGYQAELIEIRSPSIVGIVKDKTNQPVSYYDYGGMHPILLDTNAPHFAVKIKVKTLYGSKEFILDPQFSDYPIPNKKYFKSITGNNCKNSNTNSTWECTYTTYPPNWLTSNNELPDKDICNWIKKEEKLERILYINSSGINTSIPLPKDISYQSNSDLQKKLIQKGWDEQITLVTESIKRSERFIFEVEEKFNDPNQVNHWGGASPKDFPGMEGFSPHPTEKSSYPEATELEDFVTITSPALGPYLVTKSALLESKKELKRLKKVLKKYKNKKPKNN